MDNNAQVQAALAELGKTVADFKDLHTREINEIKAKGAADPVTTEAVDKANKGIDDAQKKIKALTERLDEAEIVLNRPRNPQNAKDAVDVQESARKFYNVLSDGKPVAVNAEQVKEYDEYRKNFGKFLRFSPDSKEALSVRASMSVGSNPDGGFWAPTELLSTVTTRLFETSPMRQICEVISTSAADVEFPKDTNSAVSGGWVAESETRDDTDSPPVGMQKIVTHEQFAQPKVSQKFLDDASIDVEAWLSAKIADIISRTENSAFISGDGVKQPRGILSYATAATTDDDAQPRPWGKLQYVPTGASGAFPTISGLVADDANALISTIYKLKPAYRAGASWIMNRNTMAMIRKLRDSHGQYLWQPSLVVGMPDQLEGYPVVDAEDMPNPASNSISAAFGNFKLGYRIVDRIGLRVLRDPFTSKPFVKFYTTKRVGGDVINFDAIKLLKFAAS